MKYLHYIALSLSMVLWTSSLNAQEEDDGSWWREQMKDLVYSPRYFGPSAFPMPELRSGKVSTRYEIEARGEYHYYTGDVTTDLYLRTLLPFVRGRAGLEVSFIVLEKYKLTEATRVERHASLTECPSNERYNGDVVISAFYQVLESEKWFDAMISLNLKTASGGRLVDARFTDAATYWMDATVGKDLAKSYDGAYSLRMQAMAGFYCWMTNDIVHRQNDAILYGVGFTGILDKVTLSSNLSGFNGYDHNGDNPLQLRNSAQFDFKNNIISFRYAHGMKDCLYDTYSLGYIRCF
ncbi:hypothetical protein FACS189411_03890 [Bacteroidia bacterium]|nr:hypothetical protein FACS189411_03890 [Bacteroidia bacterium]